MAGSASIPTMPDKKLSCVDCKAEFVHSERDQAFYAEKGFTEPKRCKPCREAKKQAKRSQGN